MRFGLMLLVGTINTTVVTLLPSSTCSAAVGNHEFYLNQKYLANALYLMFLRECHQLSLLRASKGKQEEITSIYGSGRRTSF